MVKKKLVSRRSLVNHWLSKSFKSIHQNEKNNLFFNGTCQIHPAFAWPVRMQRWWRKQYRKKKDHPSTPHDLVEKCLWDSSNTNCISNRSIEFSPAKILSGWAESSSLESSIEGSSSSDEESNEIIQTQWTREDRKMKKVIKHWAKETFYRQWEEIVVGLNKHIHRKRQQVS